MRIAEMRDNSHQMSLADLIRERLRVTGQKPNAASKRAGLNRDYIGDLLEVFDDEELPDPNPRRDTLVKLAKGLECTAQYLVEDSAPQSSDEAEWLYLYRTLPDNERQRAKNVVVALLPSLKSDSEKPRTKRAQKKSS